MNKQEKIREWLANEFCLAVFQCLLSFLKYDRDTDINWQDWRVRDSFILADRVLHHFHSEGAVLKVERELPELPLPHAPLSNEGWAVWQKMLLHFVNVAGYAAIEPLVKEG